MRFNCKVKGPLVKVVFFVLMLEVPNILCDDGVQNRDKRTIGVLFRSLVDAFQLPNQRQPAPVVVSYQPLRPTAAPQTAQPKPQSAKAALLASSKNIFEKKKNAFKPSTKSPDVEVITPTASPPVLPSPEEALPPVFKLGQAPPNPGPTPSLNPFSNFIPPPGQHPLIPVKAQILIHPFQGQQQASFGVGFPEPRLPPAPLNYQAQIYFHPPGGGMYPSTDQYPARYSHSNGWKDVDEIFSRGKGPDRKESKQEEAKQDKAQVTTYSNDVVPSEEPKHYESTPCPVDKHQVGRYENKAEEQRRESYQQNHNNQQQLELPLFTPNPLHNGFFNIQPFGSPYGALQGSFLVSPFGSHHGFQLPEEVGSHKQIPEGLQDSQVKYGETGSQYDDKQKSHDFIPQRVFTKTQSAQEYDKNGEDHSQNVLFYSQQQAHQPYHLDKTQYEYHQFPGKVEHLPNSMAEYQYQEFAPERNPHQTPPIHDSLVDRSEHLEQPVDGAYYLERSGCNKCSSG